MCHRRHHTISLTIHNETLRCAEYGVHIVSTLTRMENTTSCDCVEHHLMVGASNLRGMCWALPEERNLALLVNVLSNTC